MSGSDVDGPVAPATRHVAPIMFPVLRMSARSPRTTSCTVPEPLKVSSVQVRSVSPEEPVQLVSRLLVFAEDVEEQDRVAKARAERLAPSILAKAFRVELVPTEAELARSEGRDYEPASVLLERVRSARTSETQPSASKARGGPGPRATRR